MELSIFDCFSRAVGVEGCATSSRKVVATEFSV